MNIAIGERLRGRALFDRIWKYALRRFMVPVFVYGPIVYFFPKVALFYLACGAYDLGRNRNLNLSTVRRYFIGNGVLVWLLSPINILLDLLSLPYVNKGIFRLEDLPPAYQDEVRRLIKAADEADLVGQIDAMAQDNKRSMIFWRSYGFKTDAPVSVPAFEEPWAYIKTIGLSIFNKKISTSPHFGWLRPTLRVLYNVNDIKDKSAYITVGDKTSYWCENKLFIFDDTLLHRSANETDQLRYCMFVDILRPSPFPRVMAAVVALEGFLNKKFDFITFSGWTQIGRKRGDR